MTGTIGDRLAALAVHRKALAVRRALASEPGADAGTKLDVARSLVAAGAFQLSTGDMPGARASYEEALRLAEECETEGGASEQAREVLGTAYHRIGGLLFVTGDPPRGGAQRTTRRRPSVRCWSTPTPVSLGFSETWRRATTISASCWPRRATRPGRGRRSARAGHPSEAGRRQPRRHEVPAIPGRKSQQHWGSADRDGRHVRRGRRMAGAGDPAEAGRRLPQRHAIPASPGDHPLQHRPPAVRDGRHAGARAAYGKALAVEQKLADAYPSVTQFQQDLALSHNGIGLLLSATDDTSKALAEYGQALTIRQKLADTNPKVPDYRNDVASCHSNTADVLRRLGQNAEAREGYERAIAIRERLVQDHPEVTMYRSGLASSVRRRGLAQLNSGDLAGAAADTRRAMELWDGLPSRSGEEWFETACGHAALAALAGREGSRVPGDQRDTEADKAMTLLRKAVGMGYRDANNFRTESALDSLRDWPDFRLLMLDLAMPVDPLAP